MSKYNKKIIYDYIVGNDMEGYDIDELENDYEFIKEVIDYSNDKKMYDLCDDNLKGNFELTKFLILKFKDDKEFIRKVGQNFLNISDNEEDNFEINIIISKIVGRDYENFENNYNYILASTKYNELRTAYLIEGRNDSQEVKAYYQMGFDYFADMYAGRKIIIDYIAKNMVKEIFNEEDYSLEELVHVKYKTKEELEKLGLTKFILVYVSLYDSHLSDYLKTDIKLIDEFKQKLEKIYNRFDEYNQRKRNNVIEWMIEYLTNYSLETGYLSGSQLIKYISNDLNISGPRIERELEGYNDFLDEYDYPMIQKDIEYLKLKKKVKEALNRLEEPEDYFESKENNHKCKILKFNKNENNNK